MKFNKFALVLGAVVGAILTFAVAGVANADHNNPPILPQEPNVPIVQSVLSKGYVNYGLDARLQSYPGFAQQAADVAAAGTFAGPKIPAYRNDSNPDIILTAPSDTDFGNICGAGAAGCIQYWLKPAIVSFRIALGYVDWRSTIAHEGINYGHAMGEHEQYDDRHFICLPQNTWTVMSCGTYVWLPQYFDTITVWGVVIPDLPSDAYVWCDGTSWCWVNYNGLRRDKGFGHWGNPNLDNTTRIAIFYRDSGSDWAYTGYDGIPARPGAYYASRGFLIRDWCNDHPGREWGVRPESRLEITYRNNIPFVSEWREGIQVLPAGFCGDH